MTPKNIPNDAPDGASNTPTQTDSQDGKSAAAPSYSLPAYLALAGTAIREGLPPLAWVNALIFDIKLMKHGFTLELADPAAHNPSQGASLRGFIGKESQAAIEISIGCAFDRKLLLGVEARLLIEPSFHPRFHLQVKIIGIDPAVGESLLSKRLDEIRAQLKREALFGQQKQWLAPADLTRLLVIHPRFSAGWADIEDTLLRFEIAGILTVYGLVASFEGADAVPSLRKALIEAQQLVWSDGIDLVLIVRGGGAASGLAALADLELARLICSMPAPVVTGTGHAIDRSILDEVAWVAAHTPSLALQVVIRILRKRAGDALRSYRYIIAETEDQLERTFRPRLESLRHDCRQSLEAVLSNSRAALGALRAELRGSLQALPRELILRGDQLAAVMAGIVMEAKRAVQAVMTGLTQVWTGVQEQLAALARNHDQDLHATFLEIETAVPHLLDTQEALIADSKALVQTEVRRILAQAEGALATIRQSIGTLGLDGTLARGFVLALHGRAILKTRAAAEAIGTFEILFQDGYLRVIALKTEG